MGSSFLGCPALESDGLEKHAADDGIACLSAAQGEIPADQRLNALLADAFGAEWSSAKSAALLADVGFANKSLDDWLRKKFFEQHCEVFHQRPFIWHIWDGQRDSFHGRVNCHRLAAPDGEDRRTLKKLTHTYLGDWIKLQETDRYAGVEGADDRLAAAQHLKAELEKILTGEPPYDIFVRWKPLHQQPIGWEPDINDGVRINIRPFMKARPLKARGTNACILHATPKIKDYPWFWGWDPQKKTQDFLQNFVGGKNFNGNRWNDLHYTCMHKRAARARRA